MSRIPLPPSTNTPSTPSTSPAPAPTAPTAPTPPTPQAAPEPPAPDEQAEDTPQIVLPPTAVPPPPIVTAPPPAPQQGAALAPVPTAVSEHSTSVDADKQRTLVSQLRPAFVAAVADVVKVSQAAVSQAAYFYVPLIAQAALMRANPDPNVRAAADRQLRHLRGQALMNAATLGIPLQQRQEQAFINVMETLVSAGAAILVGGVPAALPVVTKLGSAALGAFKQSNA